MRAARFFEAHAAERVRLQPEPTPGDRRASQRAEDEDQQHHQTEQTEPVSDEALQAPAPHPGRVFGQRSRFVECRKCRHLVPFGLHASSLMRGSTAAYAMSASMLPRIVSTPVKTTSPITTG